MRSRPAGGRLRSFSDCRRAFSTCLAQKRSRCVKLPREEESWKTIGNSAKCITLTSGIRSRLVRAERGPREAVGLPTCRGRLAAARFLASASRWRPVVLGRPGHPKRAPIEGVREAGAQRRITGMWEADRLVRLVRPDSACRGGRPGERGWVPDDAAREVALIALITASTPIGKTLFRASTFL